MDKNNQKLTWQEIDEKEENKYEETARGLEERRAKGYEKIQRTYRNRDFILTFDRDFLVSCSYNCILYSYLLNLAGIFTYYYAKSAGIKRWKRFTILAPVLIIGNAYCLAFWGYYYPLKQYQRGLVKVTQNHFSNTNYNQSQGLSDNLQNRENKII